MVRPVPDSLGSRIVMINHGPRHGTTNSTCQSTVFIYGRGGSKFHNSDSHSDSDHHIFAPVTCVNQLPKVNSKSATSSCPKEDAQANAVLPCLSTELMAARAFNSKCTVYARALYDLYHRRSGAAGLCRRAQLDVAVMSKSAEVLRTKVFWIPGANMPADCLTKRLGNSSLMRWLMANARYALTQGSLSMLWETPLDGCETDQPKPQSISVSGISLPIHQG